MGKIADIHHAAERRAMEMTARSALDPVMERLDGLVAEMRSIAAAMTTVPGQIEDGEAGRAERLRQAIATMVQATVDATTRLSTEISSAAGQLRQDLAEHQSAASQARLQREMAVLLQALRQNSALMAGCRGRSNFRPPPRHTPQAPTTYCPKAGLAVEVCAA